MKKKNKNKDIVVIDDYYEEDDDNLYNVTVDDDLSYEDFNKTQEVTEEYEDISTSVKTTTHEEDNDSVIYYLSVFWTWFRRIGIVIAILLIAYYIAKGMFKDLFMYVLLLVCAFFFGYGFMFIIDKVGESR